MESVPIFVKNAIEARSRKDCVNGPPSFSIDTAYIPESLCHLLNNNVELDPTMGIKAHEYYKILSGLRHFKNWSNDIYWYLWKLILYIEYHKSVVDMKQYTLSKQKIARSEYRQGQFTLPVPGLLEDRPSVKENDIIELFDANDTSIMGVVTYVGRDYVTFKVSEEFQGNFTNDNRFNVHFHFDKWTVNCANHILDKVYRNNMPPMLFPHKNNTVLCNDLSSTCDINLINKNIEKNSEQLQAIKNILMKSSRPAPYILFGPPGTGKTSTLVEAICQIMIKNASTKILICTPSNAAADEIVEKLVKTSIISIDDICRMYSASRNIKDVRPDLKVCSNFVDEKAISLPRDVIVSKNIVVTTLSTCMRLHFYKLRPDHFSYLFVDEAGQATEVDTLIPYALMSGLDLKYECQISAQIVIAGDPKQLGPSVQSKLVEPILQVSMLERLMDWGPYDRNNTDNKYDPLYVTKLIQNYRSHKAILEVPNNLFYDGELVAVGGPHTARAVKWSGLPKKNFPVIFHATRGNENRERHSPSVCNRSEINIIRQYVETFLKTKCKLGGKIVKPEDIGIVTPYKLQRSKIHKALADMKLDSVSIGTVETFQGQERDIIIISTVRSVIYQSDDNYHIGFLSNPKRFNVAITRAKSLLIVVGNPDILQQDSCWRTFVKYCYNNEACLGEKFILDPSLDNLDIRQCSSERSNRKVNNSHVDKTVVEDPMSSPYYQEQVPTIMRRRRLPIGPLPEAAIDSAKSLELLLSNGVNHDNKYRELEENNFYSDETDDDDYDDENEEDQCSEICQTNDQPINDLSIELQNFMINDEDFESKLRERILRVH